MPVVLLEVSICMNVVVEAENIDQNSVYAIDTIFSETNAFDAYSRRFNRIIYAAHICSKTN